MLLYTLATLSVLGRTCVYYILLCSTRFSTLFLLTISKLICYIHSISNDAKTSVVLRIHYMAKNHTCSFLYRYVLKIRTYLIMVNLLKRINIKIDKRIETVANHMYCKQSLRILSQLRTHSKLRRILKDFCSLQQSTDPYQF